MTVAEYCRVVRESLGMNYTNMGIRIGSRAEIVRSYESEKCVPYVFTLLKMQELSGINIDEIDKRIRRGCDQVYKLHDLALSNGWSNAEVDEALQISKGMFGIWAKKIAAGYKIIYLSPYTAIRICDLYESRLSVRKHRQPAKKVDVYENDKSKQTDKMIEKKAKFALESLLCGNLKKFHFKRKQGNVYTAHSENLMNMEVEVFDRYAILRVTHRMNGKLMLERKITV